MTILKTRIAATNKKLEELKEARRTAEKTRRQAYKQSRADRQRKILLIGEAVLHRVERGEWDETEFRRMMDEALTRAADRLLFDLD
ncbi:hypothetical protein [Cupriavidus sp. UYPR2.512]|uniref:hypothetical protein n=1 Tax=Cupriavidus sp. UYPR2.512 TaxID=1080187 RepID=UPI0009D92910|nr:hypothetical protein [Cupriavidus sp. UYPR2.512]UIF88670.1 hypothetical protein KAF44_25485 [Cupriavidus necator]